MARINRIDFKDIANARISARFRQVGILILTIIIGILISISVNS
jgi:hypothetical protein